MNKTPKYMIDTVATAVARLQDLTDTSPESRCGVPNEAKEAVRLFVQSWLEEPLKDLLLCMIGEKNINGFGSKAPHLSIDARRVERVLDQIQEVSA